MSEPNTQDAPSEPEPRAADAPAAPARPDAPPARYRATLRLIRSRLVDEARSQRKTWWKPKS